MGRFPDVLLKAFDPVEGQGAVCFVGSGPSIHAGLPSWPDLLRAVARTTGVEDEVASALGDGRYLDIAQYLARIKGERAIQEKVADLIRQGSREPGEIHRLIVRLPLAGIVTTNYDLLLSDADRERYFQRPITHQTTGLAGHLQMCFMFHLHGHIDDPASIVLTKSSYDRFTSGLSAKAIQFVRTIFHSRVVLFIGFGFRDENIDAILRDLQALEVTTGWNVCALIPVPDPENPDKVLDAALRHRDIEPIYVKAERDHGVAAIAQWLRALLHVVERIRRARSSPVSKAPQAAALSQLAHLFATAEYEPILRTAIGKLEGRPDLALLSDLRGGKIPLADLMDRVDTSELRQILVEMNRSRRQPLLEGALASLPPDP